MPATTWALAAVLAAWKSREKPLWALLSGLAISVAFLIRPTNFLIAVPVVVAIGLSPRRLILAGLGSLPGIAATMAINHAAYGGYLRSGYGAIGAEFHADLVLGTLAYCMKWLPVLFSPIVIASPAIIAFFRSRPRIAALLASWAAAYIGFYSAYRWTHESWGFLRFLLPAAPAIIEAGLLVTRMCFDGLRNSIRGPWLGLLAGLLVFASLGAELAQVLSLEAWSIGRGERKYGRVTSWLVHNVPANSRGRGEPVQRLDVLLHELHLPAGRPDRPPHGRADPQVRPCGGAPRVCRASSTSRPTPVNRLPVLAGA